MSRHLVAFTSFFILIQTYLFEDVHSAASETLEVSLLPNGAGVRCDTGYDLSMEDCIQKGIDLGGYVKDNKFLGYWRHLPFGCSMEGQGGRIFYNEKPEAINNGRYSPICKTLVGVRCTTGHDISMEDCAQDGIDLGGYVKDNKFKGYWNNLPFGCSMSMVDQGGRIFYNENLEAVNDGSYSPICKSLDMEVTLPLPGEGMVESVASETIEEAMVLKGASARCATGYNLSMEDCVRDGIVLGGHVKENSFLGFWKFLPFGCSMTVKGSRIFYNTNPEAINNGKYSPICKTSEEEATLPGEGMDETAIVSLLTNGAGVNCATGQNLSMEDCVREGIVLGGHVKNNKFLGYWRNVVFGCSMVAKGGRIFYNDNPKAINDGRYSPICKSL